MVYWEAQVVMATTADFTPSSGNLTFQDGQVYISIFPLIHCTLIDLQSVRIVFILYCLKSNEIFCVQYYYICTIFVGKRHDRDHHH